MIGEERIFVKKYTMVIIMLRLLSVKLLSSPNFKMSGLIGKIQQIK